MGEVLIGKCRAGDPGQQRFRKRRCLIAADGFCEWNATGRKKQPYFTRLQDWRPLAFAGLWESCNRGEEPVESCTILTTEANYLLRPPYDRMPVILDVKDYDRWIEPSEQDPKKLSPILVPCHGEELIAYPMSTRVNKPRNDSPPCIDPVV
jgi:putative SOS response-associated peptidase YedK